MKNSIEGYDDKDLIKIYYEFGSKIYVHSLDGSKLEGFESKKTSRK